MGCFFIAVWTAPDGNASASVRFDTMPSSPMRQIRSNTVGPSPVRCSVNRMEYRLAVK